MRKAGKAKANLLQREQEARAIIDRYYAGGNITDEQRLGFYEQLGLEVRSPKSEVRSEGGSQKQTKVTKGEVRGGYEYIGGDPELKTSWRTEVVSEGPWEEIAPTPEATEEVEPWKEFAGEAEPWKEFAPEPATEPKPDEATWWTGFTTELKERAGMLPKGAAQIGTSIV